MFYLLKPDQKNSERNAFEGSSFERREIERLAAKRSMQPAGNALAPANRSFNWARFSKHAIFWILVFLIPLALMQYSQSSHALPD